MLRVVMRGYRIDEDRILTSAGQLVGCCQKNVESSGMPAIGHLCDIVRTSHLRYLYEEKKAQGAWR